MREELPPTAVSAMGPQRDLLGRLIYLQVEVPVDWHGPMLRHHKHLADLTSAMRMAGLAETIVKEQIDKAIASYRDALIEAICKKQVRL